MEGFRCEIRMDCEENSYIDGRILTDERISPDTRRAMLLKRQSISKLRSIPSVAVWLRLTYGVICEYRRRKLPVGHHGHLKREVWKHKRPPREVPENLSLDSVGAQMRTDNLPHKILIPRVQVLHARCPQSWPWYQLEVRWKEEKYERVVTCYSYLFLGVERVTIISQLLREEVGGGGGGGGVVVVRED